MKYLYTLSTALFISSIFSTLQAQRYLPVISADRNLSELTQGLNERVEDIAVYENDLILVGYFNQMDDEDVKGIAKWDGENYIPFNEPLPLPEDQPTPLLKDVLTTPLGLVVSGRMNSLGNIQVYDGNNWSSLGVGLDDHALDIIWFQDALYAAGDFDQNGLNHVAKFENGQWVNLGAGVDDTATEFAIFNEELYVVGEFSTSEGEPMNHIAKWDGTSWEQVHGGFNDDAYCMVVHNNQLLVGGKFSGTSDELTSFSNLVSVEENSIETFLNIPNAGSVGYLSNFENDLYISNGRVNMSNLFSDSQKGFLFRNDQLIELPENIAISEIIDYDNTDVFCSSTYASNIWENEQLNESALGFIAKEGEVRTEFNVNEISTHFVCSPGMFNNQSTNRSDYEIGETGASTIYRAAPWFGGITSSDEIHVSESTFSIEEDQFHLGPRSDIYDLNYLEKYARVWSVSRSQIEEHIANSDSPDYEMPEAILSWPGNGRVELGESEHLAPFVDLNENGHYNPYQGEYPLIEGDHAVFTIFSCTEEEDLGNNAALDLNIGVMLYAYESSELDLGYSTFLRYSVINTSNNDLSEFKFGLWVDGDLGTSTDDYVGCSPELNTYYTINGDTSDEASDGSINGFGENTPAQGFTFLNSSMESHLYYNIGGGNNGDPSTALDHWNYLNHTWLNGIPLTFGGDGYQTGNDPDTEASFMFPTPLSNQEFGPTDWNENTAYNNPGDRRNIGVTSAQNFNSADRLCFDIALTTSFPTERGGSYSEELRMFENVQSIQEHYDQNISSCNAPTFPLSLEGTETKISLVLYPNPASESIRISGVFRNKTDVIITDLEGRIILSEKGINANSEIDIHKLSKGLYIVNVWNDGIPVTSEKLIKN